MSPRDAARSRAAILRAAADLLEDGGPAAVTLRAVGDAAGLSRSAPYRHFGDKAELLRDLAARMLRDLADAVRDAGGEGGADGLRAGCLAYVAQALARPHHYQLIFGDTPIAAPTPDVETAADEAMHALCELVERAQAEGLLGQAPPRELATVLWTFLHGAAQLQITGHFHEPRTLDGGARLPEIVDLLLASMRTGAAKP